MKTKTKKQLKDQLRSGIEYAISKQEWAAIRGSKGFTCFDFSDWKTAVVYSNFLVESQILERPYQSISKYFEGVEDESYHFKPEACAMFRIMVLIEFARTQGIDL